MPPIVHHAIDVAATPESCWRVFADFTTWPRWFPFQARASLDGELKLGSRITLEDDAGPAHLPIHVTVEELEPAERVRWTGGKLGVRGDHSFRSARKRPA